MKLDLKSLDKTGANIYMNGSLIDLHRLKGDRDLANHKSEIKRAAQNEVRRMRNKIVRTRVKGVVKDVRLAMEGESAENALKTLDSAKSTIQKAAKKGVLKKKTASRKISRLAKQINKIK
jgi:small subunit ribosomal protein S20